MIKKLKNLKNLRKKMQIEFLVNQKIFKSSKY